MCCHMPLRVCVQVLWRIAYNEHSAKYGDNHRVDTHIIEGFEMNHWLILVGSVFAAGLLSIISPSGFSCDNNPLFFGRIEIILRE